MKGISVHRKWGGKGGGNMHKVGEHEVAGAQ